MRPQLRAAVPGHRGRERAPLSTQRSSRSSSAGPLVKTPLSRAGTSAHVPFPELWAGLRCRTGAGLGQSGGRVEGEAWTLCCRCCALAVGTKTLLPAPAPSRPRAQPVKGGHPVVRWDAVRCGGLGHLGATSAMPAPAPAAPPTTPPPHHVRTWRLSPGIGAGVGGTACWAGRGRWNPPGSGSGAGVPLLGCGNL